MTESDVIEMSDAVYCIDTHLYRSGLAACYLLREGNALAFVDTGTAHAVPRLLARIQALGNSPDQVAFIILTHVHLDHAGGAGALLAACPNARVVVHPKGAPHLVDPSRLEAGARAVYGDGPFQRDFGALTPVPEDRVLLAEEGLELDLGGRRLRCFDTPGHANHHLCLLDSRTRGLFSGDTCGVSYGELDGSEGPWLFPPTTPVAFDPEAWHRSLDHLSAQEPRRLYLTHYGSLTYRPTLISGLRRSLDALTTIALAEERKDPNGRRERLADAIAAHLIARAREAGCTLGDDRIRKLLNVDIPLNAMGLEVWLARRAKRADPAKSA